jgi:hypothetical protein
MTETDYDYESMIAEATSVLTQLEGRLLRRFLIHVVEPEFNAAYLVFDDGVFSIHGGVGGEVLQIVRVEDAPRERSEANAAVKPFDPFSIFLNRRIVQARTIGTAWNGHGFEFSFEGMPDRTMIVQSIYAGEKPGAFDDCLRLGVGSYFFDAGSDSQDRVLGGQ